MGRLLRRGSRARVIAFAIAPVASLGAVVGAVVGSGLGAAGLAGCAGIFGIDELSSERFDAGDMVAPQDASPAPESDATTPTPEAGPSGCAATGYPDMPLADSPDGGDYSITVAIDSLDFGIAPLDGGVPKPVGYNLDRFCTVTSAANSCVSTAGMADFKTYVEDKSTTGEDNSGFELLKYLTTLGDSFKPANVNMRLQEGQFSVVITIANYNGQPDDTDVSVRFYPSFGLQGADGGGAVTFDPQNDVWLVDPSELVQGTNQSKTFSKSAYVSGGKLVALFDKVAFSVSVSDPDPRLLLAFNEGVLTADIVATGDDSGALPFRLTNGIVAGRWATSDFFDAIGPLAYLGTSLCNLGSTVSFIKTGVVCPARDIMSQEPRDNMGARCDAFSAGAAFDTYPLAHAITSATSPYKTPTCATPIGDCED